MNGTIEFFLTLPPQDKRDVFEAAASRLDTLTSYVEKDFWVCLVLDVLYNRIPDGHPRLLFKGGTSLSKAFGLIKRVLRSHNLIAFRQAWKRFEEAVPGSVRLVPEAELRTVIERDYRAMQGMILGDVPDFRWVMEQLQ